jgi:NHLM bacteriocin system ABC transporter peptidase/ATP-binding protein
MEAVECGAAALGIILAYNRKWVTLEELRVQCDVSRDGSKASNILKAARHYGLEATGWKKELHEVFEFAPPFVVFWNFNHFLVVEGWDRDRVFLNNPTRGPMSVPMADFDDAFTGVILTFKPTPEFTPSGHPASIYRSLGSRLVGSEQGLLYVILTGLALLVPGILAPTYSRVFVDYYLVQGLSSWVIPLLWMMGATALTKGGLVWLQQYYLLRIETKLSLSTSAQFFWHIVRLPMDFFSQRFAGEIGSRVALNDQVASLLSGQLAANVVNLVTIFFYAVLLFSYDWLLTTLGITVAVLNLVTLRIVSRTTVDGNRHLLQEQGKLTGTAMASLQSIETIKASGGEHDVFARYAGYQAKVVNASQSLGRLTQCVNNVPGLLSSLNSTLILTIGAYRVMKGDLSVGMFLAFQGLMTQFVSPFSDLVDMGGTIQQLQGTMNRLDDVLRAKLDPAMTNESLQSSEAAPVSQAKLKGHLELRGVTFGYSRLSPPLLREFRLCLSPGQRVALIGSSGCGKSTIANLVMNLHQPLSGEILFDGKPRTEIPRSVILNSVAYVSQDITLFDGSIMDNLRMWDPSIPVEQVIAAAKDACIHADIMERPSGYDSPIAEAGTNFSGGQRQRLEIARALAINPTLLVLDEATSALDPLTEAKIDANLRRRGCSCLIVAHRLSTIRDADEIIVMSRGRVLERGTHEEMKNANGAYASLIHA